MRNKTALFVALFASLLGVRALAQPTLTYHNSGRGASVHLIAPVVGALDTFAGEMNLSLNNGPADIPSAFVGFCADLQHGVNQNDTFAVDLIPLPDAGLNNSGRAAWLYKHIKPTISSNNDAAALQLAIWNVLTDGDSDITSGAFRTTSTGSFVAKANSYLTASENQADTATWFRATNHANNRNQNMIGPDGANSVPEPASLALLGLGLMPLATRRRR